MGCKTLGIEDIRKIASGKKDKRKERERDAREEILLSSSCIPLYFVSFAASTSDTMDEFCDTLEISAEIFQRFLRGKQELTKFV